MMVNVQGVWCPRCAEFRKFDGLTKSSFTDEYEVYECRNHIYSTILLIVKKEATE